MLVVRPGIVDHDKVVCALCGPGLELFIEIWAQESLWILFLSLNQTRKA
jgi:hypothetical protein